MGQYSTGMGTTPSMWEMVSEAVHGEKLPESINKAIYALCEGRASIAAWVLFAERLPTKEHPMELMCLHKDGGLNHYNWYIDEDEFLSGGELLAWMDLDFPTPPSTA